MFADIRNRKPEYVREVIRNFRGWAPVARGKAPPGFSRFMVNWDITEDGLLIRRSGAQTVGSIPNMLEFNSSKRLGLEYLGNTKTGSGFRGGFYFLFQNRLVRYTPTTILNPGNGGNWEVVYGSFNDAKFANTSAKYQSLMTISSDGFKVYVIRGDYEPYNAGASMFKDGGLIIGDGGEWASVRPLHGSPDTSYNWPLQGIALAQDQYFHRLGVDIDDDFCPQDSSPIVAYNTIAVDQEVFDLFFVQSRPNGLYLGRFRYDASATPAATEYPAVLLSDFDIVEDLVPIYEDSSIVYLAIIGLVGDDVVLRVYSVERGTTSDTYTLLDSATIVTVEGETHWYITSNRNNIIMAVEQVPLNYKDAAVYRWDIANKALVSLLPVPLPDDSTYKTYNEVRDVVKVGDDYYVATSHQIVRIGTTSEVVDEIYVKDDSIEFNEGQFLRTNKGIIRTSDAHARLLMGDAIMPFPLEAEFITDKLQSGTDKKVRFRVIAQVGDRVLHSKWSDEYQIANPATTTSSIAVSVNLPLLPSVTYKLQIAYYDGNVGEWRLGMDIPNYTVGTYRNITLTEGAILSVNGTLPGTGDLPTSKMMVYKGGRLYSYAGNKLYISNSANIEFWDDYDYIEFEDVKAIANTSDAVFLFTPSGAYKLVGQWPDARLVDIPNAPVVKGWQAVVATQYGFFVVDGDALYVFDGISFRPLLHRDGLFADGVRLSFLTKGKRLLFIQGLNPITHPDFSEQGGKVGAAEQWIGEWILLYDIDRKMFNLWLIPEDNVLFSVDNDFVIVKYAAGSALGQIGRLTATDGKDWATDDIETYLLLDYPGQYEAETILLHRVIPVLEEPTDMNVIVGKLYCYASTDSVVTFDKSSYVPFYYPNRRGKIVSLGLENFDNIHEVVAEYQAQGLVRNPSDVEEVNPT